MECLNLLRPESCQQLQMNHRQQLPRKGGNEIDFKPVAKLFVPWGAGTWLLTELDEDGLAFGLCDLGFGSPELGYVSLDEVYAVRGPGDMRIEEDIHFKADKPLSEYAAEARRKGRIIA